jgi:hypothetical protein
MRLKHILIILSLLLIHYSCQPVLIKTRAVYNYKGMDSETKVVHKKVEDFLFLVQETSFPVYTPSSTRIEKLEYNKTQKQIRITLSEGFSQVPFRQDNVRQIYDELRKSLGRNYRDFSIQIITLKRPIEALIPNYYRADKKQLDSARMPDTSKIYPSAIVRKTHPDFIPSKGLYKRNIALWHSHGWYYNEHQSRWMWQRPRLFGTVEDLLSLSFTLPYLVPMLENSGAHVFIPRERDIQNAEIIIDNDTAPDSTFVLWSKTDSMNWLPVNIGFLFNNAVHLENPALFATGTSVQNKTDTLESARLEWRPQFPESAWYNVYVSYKAGPENCDDALYTIHHSGGSTSFFVNQQMGGVTWIYLGNFRFEKGFHPQSQKVTLSNKSKSGQKLVSGDAVKFGGGMGSIQRDGQSSGRPKFIESARYYFQSAGIPDTLVYHLNDNDDYKDDYQSRGEWVNYLNGAPNGPNKNHSAGLNIPIDAAVAFHTDAGVNKSDTTIGTLQIYSITGLDTQDTFPDGMSRYANRDLADIMQTQICDDLTRLFDPAWTRRALYEAQYSEVTRPNVPSTMLELLSHQNFLDMQFALDPRFRFHASRAVYKGLLRFISQQLNREYTVQPLAVSHFSALFDSLGNIVLNWQPVSDPLEPTANPTAYKIYMRLNDGGFDNGRFLFTNSFILKNPQPDIIYSFKVCAINDGGESFPSEILAICKMENPASPVLIINGFDRVSPPAHIDKQDYSGFLYAQDNGVADGYDYHFTGDQFNFDANDNWFSNDRPGHGASYADQETKVITGNTFDFPFIHGQAIKKAGYSFVSVSDEAVMDYPFPISDYQIADLILGEEKETSRQRALLDSVNGTSYKTFPEKMKRVIRRFLEAGKSLFVSGAYIGSDLFKNQKTDYPDKLFARHSLKFNWITDHAVRNGKVFTPLNSIIKFPAEFEFNTEYRSDIYRVEAPDAIGPSAGSKTILRYKENGMSAAVAYAGSFKIVAMGFPFETITGQTERDEIMNRILQFFKN